MSGFTIVGCLKMDVDVAVARREDATMLGRVKTYYDRFSPFQLKGNLNLFMHLHVVWSVADAVHYMELDEFFAAIHQEGKWLVWIETGRCSGFRNEAFKFFERADVCWNRDLMPLRNLGPDKEWDTRLEALGDLGRTVGRDPSKCWSAIRDRYLTAKLLDRADTVKMLAARQSL